MLGIYLFSGLIFGVGAIAGVLGLYLRYAEAKEKEQHDKTEEIESFLEIP